MYYSRVDACPRPWSLSSVVRAEAERNSQSGEEPCVAGSWTGECDSAVPPETQKPVRTGAGAAEGDGAGGRSFVSRVLPLPCGSEAEGMPSLSSS